VPEPPIIRKGASCSFYDKGLEGDNVLGDLAPDNSLLRRVPHLELTARHVGGGDKFKIG
jgi:hypothetical protein